MVSTAIPWEVSQSIVQILKWSNRDVVNERLTCDDPVTTESKDEVCDSIARLNADKTPRLGKSKSETMIV